MRAGRVDHRPRDPLPIQVDRLRLQLSRPQRDPQRPAQIACRKPLRRLHAIRLEQHMRALRDRVDPTDRAQQIWLRRREKVEIVRTDGGRHARSL